MIRARVVVSRFGASSKLAGMRMFSVSRGAREVQAFAMPSMSPTMEEGGIVEWKVKAGEKFSAGDVLLDIETDKAEISVEAGDDGILAKIIVDNGAKGIPVGAPIAVTAEEGDDLASIDYDALLKGSESKPAQAAAEAAPAEKTPAPKEEAPAPAAPAPEASPAHGYFGTDPLPSAVYLLHKHGLKPEDVKGSGPHGRITKGDVLASLGEIPRDYPAKEQARISSKEKLDLSNVKPAPHAASVNGAANGGDAAARSATEAKPEKPKPLLTTAKFPLTPELVPRVAAAQRVALRAALLSLQPRPSVLRDATLDLLTAPTRPPFVVKSAEIIVHRAKPVALEITVEEPPAEKPANAVEVFLSALRAELSEPAPA